MSNKVYEIITQKITEKLDAGISPWKQPWRSEVSAPMNAISRKPYRGVNVLLLGMQLHANPYWLTFRQAQQLGGSVRKGESSTPIVFFKQLEVDGRESDSDDTTTIPILRYYHVFNVEQCDIPEENKPPWSSSIDPIHHDPIRSCENIVESYSSRPTITSINPNRAFYRPSEDVVNVPPMSRFTDVHEYYSTLFHELVHSTGHETRLKRKEVVESHRFGTIPYAREELVAEIGAAFLCATAGIENTTLDNSAAYLKGWSEKLRNNPRWLVTAAGQAQKATDLITKSMQHETLQAA